MTDSPTASRARREPREELRRHVPAPPRRVDRDDLEGAAAGGALRVVVRERLGAAAAVLHDDARVHPVEHRVEVRAERHELGRPPRRACGRDRDA